MEFAQAFAARSELLPHHASASQNCVRWNPQRRRYELVVDGEVTAHASRLKMSIPITRERFLDACKAAGMKFRKTHDAAS